MTDPRLIAVRDTAKDIAKLAVIFALAMGVFIGMRMLWDPLSTIFTVAVFAYAIWIVYSRNLELRRRR